MYDVNEDPAPGYFSCQLCAFQTLCASYGYATITEETILEDFQAEFMKRTSDHLEEKKNWSEKLNEN